MKVLVVGDIHGKFRLFSNFLENKEYDYIFSCGDFGYWPEHINICEELKLPENTKLYFCDGNHENHDTLKKLSNNEICKNVFYMNRGSVLTINNTNILFFGGANSIDYKYRTPGYDWFPEENISEKDINNLPNNTNIDIVISHTCPLETKLPIFTFTDKRTDSNRNYLSYILNKYKPNLWFFGHWHERLTSSYNNTIFYGLNKIDDFGWYKEINIE